MYDHVMYTHIIHLKQVYHIDSVNPPAPAPPTTSHKSCTMAPERAGAPKQPTIEMDLMWTTRRYA